MSSRISLLVLATLVLPAQTLLRAQEITVPAGTILVCTLTEPNLSSKTEEVDDPILCDASPLHEFGVSVFPSGAYLGGRLAEYRDPGHFWGKGWMQLDFDRILLPGAELPISTKVISAPRLKVDAQGRIRGKGHARRDAIEWSIPILWPEKIVTLPMRGPRPVLKGESRLTLKLMQDLSIPQGVEGLNAYRQQLRPGVFRSGPARSEPSLGRATQALTERATQLPILSAAETSQTTKTGSRLERGLLTATFLVLQDGSGQVVTDYWFESGERVRFVSVDGTTGVLPIGRLDLQKTVKLNRERGVEFVIRSRDADSSSNVEGDVRLPSGGENEAVVTIAAAREQ